MFADARSRLADAHISSLGYLWTDQEKRETTLSLRDGDEEFDVHCDPLGSPGSPLVRRN